MLLYFATSCVGGIICLYCFIASITAVNLSSETEKWCKYAKGVCAFMPVCVFACVRVYSMTIDKITLHSPPHQERSVTGSESKYDWVWSTEMFDGEGPMEIFDGNGSTEM